MMRYLGLLTIVLFVSMIAGCGRSDALGDQSSPAPAGLADTTPSHPTPILFGLDATKAAIDQAIAEGRATAIAASQVAETTPICLTDWADSADRNVTLSCSKLAATAKVIEDTRYRQAQMTQIALNPQSQSYVLPSLAITQTPGPPLTTPVVQVQADDVHDFVDGSVALRNSSSIWTLGKLRGREVYDIDTLYILTRAPDTNGPTTLVTFVEGSDIGPNSWPQYNGAWQAPHEMGTMRITAITGVSILATGLTGTATFITSTGASGTFDLATHAWTITAAGTPVVEPQTARYNADA